MVTRTRWIRFLGARVPVWALLAGGVAHLAACAPPGEERRGPPRPGDPLPEFGAPTLAEGDSVFLSSFRGHPVVVNVWATWCAPCRMETPHLQETYERLQGRGLEMVGITVDSRGARQDALDFVGEMGVTYHQLHDAAQVSMDAFHVLGLPVTYVADTAGVIRFARVGPVFEGDAEFDAVLRDLVGPEEGGEP